MKNKIRKVLIIVSLFALFVVFLGIKNSENIKNTKNIISLGKCSFLVEVADTVALKTKGLSRRESLCEDCGMLFLFPKGEEASFWMKDMNFPLDIIWLLERKVLRVDENISHNYVGIIESPGTVHMVLEVNAEKSFACGIMEGSVLK